MNLFNILNDGHPLISYVIIILLGVVIYLFIKGLKEQDTGKTIALIASIGWFALAWGYMGRTIGLIGAFDNVAASGEFAPSMLSEGLKMALVGPMCGLITFLSARAGIIVLTLRQKKK